MRRVENPELKQIILKHLSDQYRIKEVREPNHLSTYVYCRTKGFFEQTGVIEPTEQEVMMFSLGYGLQDVLTPKDASAPVIEKHGVIYRPDMVFKATDQESMILTELKTTRKSAKKHFIDEELAITWLEYMKGGCYIQDTNRYDLVVLYMMGNYAPPFPQIYSDTFFFDDKEISENWDTIMSRKAVLDSALKSQKIPTPFQHRHDWECNYCRYKMVCDTLNMQEIQKLWE
jgi:hypothetical protein